MAYINTEDVALIRKTLKAELPEFKFAVRKEASGLAVNVAIVEGKTDFSPLFKHEHLIGRSHAQINPYHLYQYGEFEPLFEKIVTIIKTAPNNQWYDRSDAMVDYFDTAYYFHLNVGNWDKPYKLKEAV